MSRLSALTLRLDEDDYKRLREQAESMGVPPATLARMYVRSKLSDDGAVSRRRREGIAALDRLAALTRDLPQIDAVRMARESRDELNNRPELQ